MTDQLRLSRGNDHIDTIIVTIGKILVTILVDSWELLRFPTFYLDKNTKKVRMKI